MLLIYKSHLIALCFKKRSRPSGVIRRPHLTPSPPLLHDRATRLFPQKDRHVIGHAISRAPVRFGYPLLRKAQNSLILQRANMAETEQRLLMLIDDEPAQSRLITALAAREGWRTLVVNDAETAVAMLGTRQGMQLGAVILDQWVPGDEACSLIADLRSRRPALPILMLTTSASPLLAVEAMRAGATDYLIKPVAPDRLMNALRNATTRETPRDELQPLTEKMSGPADFESMIGAAPAFRTALAIAAKAARGQGHLLIEGESGTGKEMLVRAIHAASQRAKMPMRIVNAGSTPGNSIESALFGHEKGAFPGAFDRQMGAIQYCDGATLVIDEIDRMP
ncbi:hypothetical protein E4T56_gene3365, partial [Termitomyces sp. T112]